jgi:Domain of unknown function (DUF4403)
MSAGKLLLSLLAASLLATTICSCASKPLVAERPLEEAFRMELKREVSTLNVPIETSTYDLARVLNRTLRSELYKGSTRTSGLTADVLRNGDISISAADNYLYITVPITMSLSYRMFETPSVPLKLKFRVYAGVSSDWRVRTEVHYLGLSDLMAEEVGIGFVKFKPRKIVDDVTLPLQQMLSAQITQNINDLFPLKAQIANVWNTAHKPVLLDKNYNAWLKLTPSEVLHYPMYAHNNSVKLSVGISTFAELVVGPEPASQSPSALPDLKLVNTFDKTFRVALKTDLFYRDLRSIASTLLLNKPFENDGKSIVIKDFDLYGNGEKLVVKLQTEGSLDGIFYLTAKPAFDPQTKVFSLVDVDFDMQTQSLLLKSGDWLLHGTIRSMIQEKLNMNLSEQLEKSRQMAGKALEKKQLADNVFFKGDIKTLKFNDMVVQKDKISIQVYTEGESAVVVQ